MNRNIKINKFDLVIFQNLNFKINTLENVLFKLEISDCKEVSLKNISFSEKTKQNQRFKLKFERLTNIFLESVELKNLNIESTKETGNNLILFDQIVKINLSKIEIINCKFKNHFILAFENLLVNYLIDINIINYKNSIQSGTSSFFFFQHFCFNSAKFKFVKIQNVSFESTIILYGVSLFSLIFENLQILDIHKKSDTNVGIFTVNVLSIKVCLITSCSFAKLSLFNMIRNRNTLLSFPKFEINNMKFINNKCSGLIIFKLVPETLLSTIVIINNTNIDDIEDNNYSTNSLVMNGNNMKNIIVENFQLKNSRHFNGFNFNEIGYIHFKNVSMNNILKNLNKNSLNKVSQKFIYSINHNFTLLEKINIDKILLIEHSLIDAIVLQNGYLYLFFTKKKKI